MRYIEQVYRKRIEVAFSRIEHMPQRSIYAMTACSFEREMFLFVRVLSVNARLRVTTRMNQDK